MAITAKDVAALRERTGAGMMDCKKALEETNGDIDKAVELLRTKGIAKAEKRAGRAAKEGLIGHHLSTDGKLAAIVEVNCETDFVARNEGFRELAKTLVDHVVTANPASVESDARMGELAKEASAKTGENVQVRRFARYQVDGEGVVGHYVHHNGKLAVITEVGTTSAAAASSEDVRGLARTLSEHIAAAAPLAVDRDQIPAEKLETERRIAEEQARATGKPENILTKIAEGKVEAYVKEVTLMNQPWVRDPAKTIGDLVKEVSKKAGEPVQVRRFTRFQIGEE
jgi:elongation factor Ts